MKEFLSSKAWGIISGVLIVLLIITLVWRVIEHQTTKDNLKTVIEIADINIQFFVCMVGDFIRMESSLEDKLGDDFLVDLGIDNQWIEDNPNDYRIPEALRRYVAGSGFDATVGEELLAFTNNAERCLKWYMNNAEQQFDFDTQINQRPFM